MRKNRWIAPVWGMLAAAAFGQTASAQVPASPLDGPFPPAGSPAVPGPVNYAGHPTYTPIAPDAASPAGYPPSMEPWPTISPYEHAVDSTYNDRGIWFRETLNHQRKYKINAEFISGRFRQPGNATIGSAAAISPGFGTDDGVDPSNIFGVKDHMVYSARGRYISEDVEYPEPPGAQEGGLPRSPNFFFQTQGDEGGGGGAPDDFTFPLVKVGLLQVTNSDAPINGTIDESELSNTVLYPVTGQVLGDDAVTRFGGLDYVVGEKRENPASPGIRLTLGLEDEDETGVDWNGYWLNGQGTVFRRGLDDPDRPRLTNVVFFDAPWLGPDAAEFLDYNVLFEVRHESETAGTDLAFYHTPFVDYGWLKLRPLYGARYNYIREQFNFTGRDNGSSIAYNIDGTPGQSSNFVPFTVEAPITGTIINPYETSVTSKVQSHLYGPQVGVDMQVGGEHLMITSAAKTGIVANTEKLALGAYGFGSQEALTAQRAFFSDSKTHTRVAPFLEFNANADINVFPIIPVVNRWGFLKNARVRAGWSTLIVGNVQRPLDQIVWRSENSGGPFIKENGRDAWYVQYWNLGVNWNF